MRGHGHEMMKHVRANRFGGRSREQRFDDLISPLADAPGCWLWTGAVNEHGYGRLGASFVHRLAWERASGPVPSGLFVLHRCDVASCVNPDHLFLGTIADNNADMVRKGRQRSWKIGAAAGERNPFAKLTREQASHIRVIASTGVVSSKRIAAAFGVSATTVWNISHGKAWR